MLMELFSSTRLFILATRDSCLIIIGRDKLRCVLRNWCCSILYNYDYTHSLSFFSPSLSLSPFLSLTHVYTHTHTAQEFEIIGGIKTISVKPDTTTITISELITGIRYAFTVSPIAVQIVSCACVWSVYYFNDIIHLLGSCQDQSGLRC